MFSIGNCEGKVFSRDKMFHLGPSTHTKILRLGQICECSLHKFKYQATASSPLIIWIFIHLVTKLVVSPCAFITAGVNICPKSWKPFPWEGKLFPDSNNKIKLF